MFAQNVALEGFTCHNGKRSEVLVQDSQETSLAETSTGAMLAALKAQDLFAKELPALGDHPNDRSTLVVLQTGEVCRVDFVEMDHEKTQDQHADILAIIRKELPEIAKHLSHVKPKNLDLDKLVLVENTAIHTLMCFDQTDSRQQARVSEFLGLEGLQLRESDPENRPFAPGWSYSSLARTDLLSITRFAAVVMRLQGVWYQQRGQRDFCIEQTSLLAKHQTIESDITSSHEVVRRLFDVTVWGHELRDFSANLKPWLKVAFDDLYQFWDMAEESDYVEKTLRYSHELLASGYQSRILIQERQQSRLLFIVAAVGLLGIFGSLMSIWTALEWGTIVSNGYWATDSGNIILFSLIAANVVILAAVLYRFVTTQFK
ncbi:hypothetical protein [Sulfitobacter donghicola]|uniref:Uncharacterized protein n=1 Tax=Sulfitobacter donghicola DSW-25 = KCTC 12864 = JCM 14565 TaxID=1300350 RepID=A0A073IHA7_9RHOB|nr:hypothetical protein [Sulfitobacter donghicola]KEJ88896.1 hypothetical protein DSW25_14580 [Sulfitobacter donghicola DSW-25 = KCTC 12864 = JCM 14565]